jgi:hypothetical protein
VFDTTAPTVSSVSSTSDNGTYKLGDVIPLTITFSETVTVTGTPQLTLETGSSDAVVNYSSGSPGTTLTFNYTVASGHNSSDLSTSALALNSGTIKDAAGNAATLTLPGLNPYSLSFDGTDDYVSIADADELDGMSQLTIQFYVKWDSYPYSTYGKGVQVLEKWQTASANAVGAYSFYTHYDADMFTYMVQTQNNQLGINIGLSSNMSLGTWYQVTGVYDGQYSYLYLNGVLKGQVAMSGSVASTTYPLELANQNSSNTTFFDGNIDEVAIWNDALMSAEVTALYNSGSGLSASSNSGNYTSSGNLQGYWSFNTGTGTTLTDQTSNGNNGPPCCTTNSTIVSIGGLIR